MSTPMDPLMDLVIHAQDVARPLGLQFTSPPEVVAASLGYVASNRFMGGPRRLAGIRAVSTDTGCVPTNRAPRIRCAGPGQLAQLASTMCHGRVRSRRRARHVLAIPTSAEDTNLPECNRCQTKPPRTAPPQ